MLTNLQVLGEHWAFEILKHNGRECLKFSTVTTVPQKTSPEYLLKYYTLRVSEFLTVLSLDSGWVPKNVMSVFVCMQENLEREIFLFF